MSELGTENASLPPDLQPATAGAGPLLQRDYWAVVDNARTGPKETMGVVASQFPEFSPKSLAAFTCERPGKPLEVGDNLDIHIALAGNCQVRVLHRDDNSLTLGTLQGHPEAGRITFGAYRNKRGDVIFHIRSRARASSPMNYVGFLGLGEAMQTETWAAFINNVAATVGKGVLGVVHADTEVIEDEPADEATLQTPTFIAKGE